MSKRNDWLPYAMSERLMVIKNLGEQIHLFKEQLSLTDEQVERIEQLCNCFVYLVQYGEEVKGAFRGFMTWRDQMINGEVLPGPPSATPIFPPSEPPAGMSQGVISQLRRFVEVIKAAPGYTSQIGIILRILPPTRVSRLGSDFKPHLVFAAAAGWGVTITGSLEGATLTRVEMKRKGEETWSDVGLVTNFPHTIRVEPKVPGVPETNSFRGRLFHKNNNVGDYSPIGVVTISEQ